LINNKHYNDSNVLDLVFKFFVISHAS
jgi:hypothetical protein